ncbi:MAG: EF-P lysine aminoacylase EpmA [Myxococcota bacterium]
MLSDQRLDAVDIKTVLQRTPPAYVRVSGRVASVQNPKEPRRSVDSGGSIGSSDSVVILRDLTGELPAQCLAAPPLGSWVIVEGQWNGAEVTQGRCMVQSVPRLPFPAAESDWRWLHDEVSRRGRYLMQRAQVMKTVRAFFDRHSFIEVETPLLVPSPGLDVHLSAFEVEDASPSRFLITSPEYQMKRLVGGGLPRIYQTCKCFRQEELGPLHEPEFSMLEWYRALATSGDLMRDTEELVTEVARAILGGTTQIPALGRPVDVKPPWARIRVDDAFRRYAGVEVDDILPDEEHFFRVLVEKVQPQLGSPKPVFLTHWPASMASLARLESEDPSRADRFEAYIDGVELCNGFGELVDPIEQRQRLEADQARRASLGLPVYPIDERFMSALQEGLPPCSGNALGLDRLVMLTLGAPRVQDVIAIPTDRAVL